MFGQGVLDVPDFGGVADFCSGGVVLLGGAGAGLVVVELVGAAEAPAMPAAAPPAASAPVTIVAWSILDIRILERPP
jgi:hypothetical protein